MADSKMSLVVMRATTDASPFARYIYMYMEREIYIYVYKSAYIYMNSRR